MIDATVYWCRLCERCDLIELLLRPFTQGNESPFVNIRLLVNTMYSGRSLLNSLRFRKMAFCYHDRFIARVGVQFKWILNRARPSVAPSINDGNVAFGAVLMNVWLRTSSTTMTIIQIIDIGLTTQCKCLRPNRYDCNAKWPRHFAVAAACSLQCTLCS